MIFKSRTFIGDIRTGALHVFLKFFKLDKIRIFLANQYNSRLEKKISLQIFQFAILQRNTEKLATKYMDAPLQYIVN